MITFLSIVASLVVIEILLSVDNALVNATIAESLPETKRKKAIQIGILLGAVFRIALLFVAAFIIQNEWIKIVGGLYLLWLFVEHVGKEITDEGKVVKKVTHYKRAIFEIALADLVFSLDNVISAVSFSDNTIYVIFGVLVGILSMLFITPLISKVIHRYKGLPTAAYTIVGLIGLFLIVETMWHIHISEVSKFLVIVLIIMFTIWYEKNRHVRKIFKPLLETAAKIVGLPLDAIRLLKVIAGFKNKKS